MLYDIIYKDELCKVVFGVNKFDFVKSIDYLDWLSKFIDSSVEVSNSEDFVKSITNSSDIKNISMLIDFAEYVKTLSGVYSNNQVVKPIILTSDSLMYKFYYDSHYYDLILNYKEGYEVSIRYSERKPENIDYVRLSNKDFELVQYIVVNKDLNMSAGKLAAQVGHACTICAVNEFGNALFTEWYRNSQKKIVLAGHQKDLEKLESEGYYAVRDNGLTEIPSGSLTAISLGVNIKEDVLKCK